MSEWTPEVVRLGKVRPHPNFDSPEPSLRCDTLSYVRVYGDETDTGGYPVLFRTGDFKEGDLAAYLPIESRVPVANEPFTFLSGATDREGYARIKAKRLRGFFSMGLLVPAPAGMAEGESVVETFGLKKYDPAEEAERSGKGARGGMGAPPPKGWDFPRYTDIEGMRKYKHVVQLGEEVIITEKIHGQNGRYVVSGDDDDQTPRLWVGSRTVVKARDENVNWWHVAGKLGLEEKLAAFPGTIFYGEVYGKSVQDLAYGLTTIEFRVFDTFDVAKGTYNDWDETVRLATAAGLQLVPILYRGPWLGYEAHLGLAEGTSTLAGHVKEGYVVKPTKERCEHRCGRVIFKCVGEGYLLRKEGKV